MTDTNQATIHIGDITRTLPLQPARDLFLAAMIARAKKRSIAIDANTLMVIGSDTDITLESEGAFTDEHDIAGFLSRNRAGGRSS